MFGEMPWSAVLSVKRGWHPKPQLEPFFLESLLSLQLLVKILRIRPGFVWFRFSWTWSIFEFIWLYFWLYFWLCIWSWPWPLIQWPEVNLVYLVQSDISHHELFKDIKNSIWLKSSVPFYSNPLIYLDHFIFFNSVFLYPSPYQQHPYPQCTYIFHIISYHSKTQRLSINTFISSCTIITI